MAYNLESNPDGLGWRKVISWSMPFHVKRRWLRFDTLEAAEAEVTKRLNTKGQVCRVVPAV